MRGATKGMMLPVSAEERRWVLIRWNAGMEEKKGGNGDSVHLPDLPDLPDLCPVCFVRRGERNRGKNSPNPSLITMPAKSEIL